MDIKSICEDYNIKNYTINEDGSIDVDGNVSINRQGIKELPIQFRNIEGNFNCYSNKLTTLKGCPIRVGGDFVCSWNNLKDLKHSPKIVVGNFYCHNNELECINDGTSDLFGDFYSDELPISGLVYSHSEPIKIITNYKQIHRLKKRKQTIEKLLSNK
jgi:hypothetical protein